ncbi:hypothetical protein DVH24_031029 [Malus domestica]|uniref:Uncharacterized protein n=1 Tax=Malus domestica TaxID=3750 RepID=A0A498HB72_MALDO|nr:hypothetical protein DVH24_031029 [Malus domestica]
MTTAPCSIPKPPTSTVTTPGEMDPRPVDPISLRVSQAPASSTSSVTLPVSTKHAHYLPGTLDMISASTTDASGSQPSKVK